MIGKILKQSLYIKTFGIIIVIKPYILIQNEAQFSHEHKRSKIRALHLGIIGKN